jgi:16S rRNA (cytosine1402-N4)-methyltransferase
MVKEAFKEAERQGTLKILTKHVIRPSEEEERANPRSRSAKLRCAERV